MIFTNKMISLEIALSKNGVFALSLTVHHRILDILGYASFETYSFEECPWNMWKSMNFLKSICLGLTCLGVSQTWGMRIHACSILGDRNTPDVWDPCRTCPCFFWVLRPYLLGDYGTSLRPDHFRSTSGVF